jgi:hypothetical protein
VRLLAVDQHLPFHGILQTLDVGTTYWQRKQEELELLFGAIGEPARRVPNVEALIATKQELRSKMLARFFALHPKLTESNLWHAEIGRLRWKYLRFDQRIFVPVEQLYPGLQERVAFAIYAASGMSAISAALASLDEIGRPIGFPIDGYFETLRVAGRLKNRLIEQPAPIVYLDSICRDARSFDEAEIVVCDTTCWDCESPRITALVDRCREERIPCILLRSHLKLDCLALEYGRLGSMVVVLPDHPDRSQVAFAKKLRAGFLDRLTLWGAQAAPEAIFPLAEAARALDRIRIETIVRNHLGSGEKLRELCAPTGVEVRHHGCFFILRPLLDRVSDGERYLERLVSALAEAGLFARELPSFGYDLIGVTLLRAPDRTSSIRVALPDFSDGDREKAIEIIGREASSWLPTRSP